MAAWGAGLFCDDVACDVRAQFRDMLEDGRSVAQATRRILADWAEALDDPEDGPVIWLALASLQWDRGALQARVKSKALRAIDSGADIERWRSAGDTAQVKQRKNVLSRLRKKLLSPPPAKRAKRRDRPARKRPSKAPEPIDWQVGEVFAYRLKSRDWILLHVVELKDTGDARYPTVAVLDWRGREIPGAAAIKSLPYLKPPATTVAWGGAVADIGERRAYCIGLAHRKLTGIPRGRIRRLDVKKKLPFRKPRGWNPGVLWRLFDSKLKDDLGLA